MNTIKIAMPQMAAFGLSENWLFKHCGDAHWRAITGLYGVESHELVTENGERVYPSFVAIRARYDRPIGTIKENDVIDFSIGRIEQFGAAIHRSRQIGVMAGQPVISMEMITKFVVRTKAGRNDLARASVHPRSIGTASHLDEPPELIRDFQKIRANNEYAVSAPSNLKVRTFNLNSSLPYTPNPFVDYNGAGLLYFAAYPAIADQLERVAISARLHHEFVGDWAMSASTLARETFYFGNLDLGSGISGNVRRIELMTGAGSIGLARLHTTLAEAGTGRRLAEVYTLKSLHN